jgi:hypothetical protein
MLHRAKNTPTHSFVSNLYISQYSLPENEYHLHNTRYLTCTYENTKCCVSEMTPSEHPSSPQVLYVVYNVQFLVSCVVFCPALFSF